MDARQRLAIVTSRCFVTAMPATKDILRHAAYSQRVGREIRSSDDLTDDEVKTMLEQWEDYQLAFSPSERGRKEIQAAATKYQESHGQTRMEL